MQWQSLFLLLFLYVTLNCSFAGWGLSSPGLCSIVASCQNKKQKACNREKSGNSRCLLCWQIKCVLCVYNGVFCYGYYFVLICQLSPEKKKTKVLWFVTHNWNKVSTDINDETMASWMFHLKQGSQTRDPGPTSMSPLPWREEIECNLVLELTFFC